MAFVEAVLGALRARGPILARAAVGMIALAALSAAPWFFRTVRSAPFEGFVDWKAAVGELRAEIAPEDFVVAGVTDDIFPIGLYLGRADAHLGTPTWVVERARLRDRPAAIGAGPYELPTWSDAAPILQLLEDHPRVWLIFATRRVEGSRVSPTAAIRELADLGVTRHTPGGVTVIRLDRNAAAERAE